MFVLDNCKVFLPMLASVFLNVTEVCALAVCSVPSTPSIPFLTIVTLNFTLPSENVPGAIDVDLALPFIVAISLSLA